MNGKMKNLLMIIAALTPALGCTIHEPQHEIIYTPEKQLTNTQPAQVSPTAIRTAGLSGESNKNL